MKSYLLYKKVANHIVFTTRWLLLETGYSQVLNGNKTQTKTVDLVK
ncbi:hypothetical protein QJ527_09010 [Enterococcus mundtii]|nr:MULTISPECIES: hypothetical protein [Enterococcus]MDK4211670.1 hypothetical protein [Enterococcus mundtii]MEC3941181.1 hypothetical protein [Enterococcus mundtii]